MPALAISRLHAASPTNTRPHTCLLHHLAVQLSIGKQGPHVQASNTQAASTHGEAHLADEAQHHRDAVATHSNTLVRVEDGQERGGLPNGSVGARRALIAVDCLLRVVLRMNFQVQAVTSA